MVCVSTTLNNNEKMHIICIYLEPKYSCTKLELLLNNLEKIYHDNSDDKFLIIGDWNIPEFVSFNCDALDLARSANIELLKCRLLYNFLCFCDLNQLNHVVNSNNKLLDLFISNFTLNVELCDCPLANIDIHHPPLTCEFETSCNIKPQVFNRDYKKSNYHTINSIFCNIDWVSLFNNNRSASGCVDTFYNLATRIINEFTPVKKDKPKHYPHWFSYNTIRLLKNKRDYHKRWKMYGNLYDYQRFSHLRSECHASIDSDHSSFVRNCERNIISTPKSFWSYVNSKRKDSQDLPVNVRWGDKVSTNNYESAELFAHYFESTFSSSTFNAPETVDYYGVRLSSLEVSYDEVFERLLELNDDSSFGPDGIPPLVLKKCAFSLTFPLTLLFNISLQTGCFPTAWKISYITPIFKSGNKNVVNNYRPICRNSSIAQIFDCIVTKKLTLTFKDFIAPQQHGFCKGRSTLTNLISFTERIHSAFSSRCQFDAIYTDFSKAFDSVNHSALIFKLACSGISGDLLRWLESYLKDRFLVVRLSKCYSKSFRASSGVPQGSHLGPLLFTLFINDLSWTLNSEVGISMFADDLKIFKTITGPADVASLQGCLDTLSEYCSKYHLKLNVEKCFQISFSRRVACYFPAIYALSGRPLTKVDTVKDLGVLLDSKLTFNAHFKYCYNKALKMLGFLFRVGKDFRNLRSLKIIYFAFVRSHLEYCCQVWNPSKITTIAELEKIQKKFVRFLFHKNLIPGITYSTLDNDRYSEYSYTRCLSQLNIQPLQDRRIFFDVDLILKTFTDGLDSSGFRDFFTFPPLIRNLRSINSFQISNTKSSNIDRCMKTFNDLNLCLSTLSRSSYTQVRNDTLQRIRCNTLVLTNG
jgi:hypothetical protein